MKNQLLRSLLMAIASQLFLIHSVLSQNVSDTKLQWEVSSAYNIGSGKNVTLSSEFVSDNSVIEWRQKNGAHKYEFAVNSIEGNWLDVSQGGEIQFNISFRGSRGTMKFKRENNTVTAEIDLQLDGKNAFPYRFSISSVSPY